MSLIEKITASSWTLVAMQIFDAYEHKNVGWHWKGTAWEQGEIARRIADGRIMTCQKKIEQGVFHLLARLPKNSPNKRPQTEPDALIKPPAARTTTDYDALLQEASRRR